MQKSRFSRDAFGEDTFEGFTNGDDWNGFVRPYFERDEAQRIVEASNKCGVKASYNPESDAFSFATTRDAVPYPDTMEEIADIFGPIEIEGERLYAIGAGIWAWRDGN